MHRHAFRSLCRRWKPQVEFADAPAAAAPLSSWRSAALPPTGPHRQSGPASPPSQLEPARERQVARHSLRRRRPTFRAASSSRCRHRRSSQRSCALCSRAHRDPCRDDPCHDPCRGPYHADRGRGRGRVSCDHDRGLDLYPCPGPGPGPCPCHLLMSVGLADDRLGHHHHDHAACFP
eukprot:6025875-Pleurochrysis_carterae.AAC.1